MDRGAAKEAPGVLNPARGVFQDKVGGISGEDTSAFRWKPLRGGCSSNYEAGLLLQLSKSSRSSDVL